MQQTKIRWSLVVLDGHKFPTRNLSENITVKNKYDIFYFYNCKNKNYTNARKLLYTHYYNFTVNSMIHKWAHFLLCIAILLLRLTIKYSKLKNVQ